MSHRKAIYTIEKNPTTKGDVFGGYIGPSRVGGRYIPVYIYPSGAIGTLDTMEDVDTDVRQKAVGVFKPRGTTTHFLNIGNNTGYFAVCLYRSGTIHLSQDTYPAGMYPALSKAYLSLANDVCQDEFDKFVTDTLNTVRQ